jgi:phage recombination protein Bet
MSDKLITGDSAAFSAEQQKLITDVLCKGATPTEVEFCMQVAKRCGLDPFRRQIHFTKRYDGTLQREVLTPIVGIDGLRAIAARSGAYAGNDEPKFEVDKEGLPIKATVTVYRIVQGQKVGFTASVWYSESVQMKGRYEGYGQGKKKVGEEPNSMWAKRPFGQLGKCAEGAALRKAYAFKFT